MKIKINRKIIFIALSIIVFLSVIIAGCEILINIGNITFSFYYPDDEWKSLASENRTIKISQDDKDYLELKLVSEYNLGPINYRLRLDLPEDITLLNVWKVSNNILIINLSKSFERFAHENMKECGWYIKGLTATIKKNTQYKKMLFLIENKRLVAVVNGQNLAFPISVYPEKGKLK